MIGAPADDGKLTVTDPSDAGAVYGRGFFGTLADEGLRLDAYESVYLTEMDRLEAVDPKRGRVDWSELFRRAARASPEFDVRYVVYRDLRQRGYVVRASPPPIAFSVLPRGGTLHKTPSKYWVQPCSERAPFRLAEVLELARRAQGARKNLLLALVDEESDLTYYRIRRPNPRGALAPALPPTPVPGWLGTDRVVVFDADGVRALGDGLAFGSRIGARLELSLLEASYLLERGALAVRDVRTRRSLRLDALLKRARRAEAEFDQRIAAYRALRAAQLVVKTGFKYGAHFRAYLRNPEHTHARYLVQAVGASHEAPWPEVAGSVRVAQGVRKEFLLAAVDRDSVSFLELDRVRP